MRKGYPEEHAELVWQVGDVTCSIAKQTPRKGDPWYCGYARFPNRPVRDTSYDGFLNYVPVHCGINWIRPHDDGSLVFGFSCDHSGDVDNLNCQSMEWLKAECEKMAVAIPLARQFELGYEEAESDDEKATVIRAYHEALEAAGVSLKSELGLGQALKIITGEL